MRASMPDPFERPNVSILSPLRYPGAKRRLAGYIAAVLRLNGLKPKLLVEPFAGGASVALQLLNDGLVEKIALGEKDPLVASLWKVVFREPDWLIGQLESIEVSVENWRYYRSATFRSDRQRALACMFLNRTSFSGILAHSAGPIGGYEQKSEYSIDCRFPVGTLSKRIRQASELSDRVVFVNVGDWRDTMQRARALRFGSANVLYYLDPPFYEKARKLYRFAFEKDDHAIVRDALMRTRSPWILSYDPVRPILDLYYGNGRGPKRVELFYSAAAQGKPSEAQELIITNLQKLPGKTRLWRSVAEWRGSAKK